MRALIRFLAWLWPQDASLGAFLAVLIGIVFFLLPLTNYRAAADVVASVAASLLLISGSLALIRRSWLRRLVVAVAVSAVVVRCVERVPGGDALVVAGALLSTVVLALLLIMFLVEVYRPGRITRFRILGAVAAYLLLGLTWAYVYTVVEFAAPGSLRFPDGAQPHASVPRIEAELVYFSFVALTTLGFGDIVPVSPFARSMTVLEALLGQLFIATLIGRLVSLREPSPSRHEPGPPPAA